MRTGEPTLLIDLGSTTVAASVVTDQGSWLVPDPASGESRWPAAIHTDGQFVSAGAAAEQRARSDAAGYASGLKAALATDTAVQVGSGWLRPVELVAELFSALRNQAQRQLGTTSQGGLLAGPLERAVITVPASLAPGDPRRGRLIAAAEAAGFTAVELLSEPAAAVWAPGASVRVGDVALIYDLGATFEAAVIRVGDDLPEILGQAAVQDWPAEASGPGVIDLTLACCQDLLDRLGPGRAGVGTVLTVGGGARAAGLAAALEQGLGLPVTSVDEPELAVIRGAAAWLPRSGPRTVLARPASDRMVPLVFTIPGGSAQLLRWLVDPGQPYDEGAPVARIRLAAGVVWDLAARARGTMDQVLVPVGQRVQSGEWLALVRPR